MRKKQYIISILLIIFVIFAFLYVIDHNKMYKNESVLGKEYHQSVGITQEEAVENIKKILDDKSKATITNYDNPKTEEIVFDTEMSIYCFEEKSNFDGKNIYKITFNTTQDGLLGPIVCYVDKLTGVLIGADFRE